MKIASMTSFNFPKQYLRTGSSCAAVVALASSESFTLLGGGVLACEAFRFVAGAGVLVSSFTTRLLFVGRRAEDLVLFSSKSVLSEEIDTLRVRYIK